MKHVPRPAMSSTFRACTPLRRTLWLPALLALLLTVASPAFAGEGFYFKLKSPGTASVFISKTNHVAVFHDGGNRNGRGIAGADVGVNPMKLTDYLSQLPEVQTLVFSCSHPDEDHLGGLATVVCDKEFIVGADAAVPRFKRVIFIDAAVPAEKQLAKIYEDCYQKASLHFDGAKADAFKLAGVFDISEGDVEVENWVNPDTSAPGGVHGRSLIPIVTFRGADNSKYVLADMDDSSPALAKAFAAAMQKEKRRIDCIVIPHHGSKRNPVEDILGVPGKSEGIPGVSAVTVTVDTDNQYLHPGLHNLQVCLDVLKDEDRIFITALGNVRIDEHGPRQTERTVGALYTFVHDQRLRAEMELNTSKDLSTGKHASLCDEREAAIVLEQQLQRPSPPTAPSGAAVQAGGPRPDSGPDVAESPESPNSPKVQVGSREPLLPESPEENGKRWDKNREHAKQRAKGELGSGKRQFERNLIPNRKPDLGGIQIGAQPTAPELHAESAKFVLSSETRLWTVEVTTDAGNVTSWAMPASELAIAHRLVSQDTTALVTATGNELSVNPLIWDTVIGYDGALLDKLVGQEPLKLNTGSTLQPGAWGCLLWYDAPAVLSANDGRLGIAPSSGNPECCLRIRFLERKAPDWVRTGIPPKPGRPGYAEYKKWILEDAELKAIHQEVVNEPFGITPLQKMRWDARVKVVYDALEETLWRDLEVPTKTFCSAMRVLIASYPCAATFERLARARALLRWLQVEGCLPAVPDGLVAQVVRRVQPSKDK